MTAITLRANSNGRLPVLKPTSAVRWTGRCDASAAEPKRNHQANFLFMFEIEGKTLDFDEENS
ncbi:MAG: hypothetical protein R3B47_03515 [Bacteroidia bacterium]